MRSEEGGGREEEMGRVLHVVKYYFVFAGF